MWYIYIFYSKNHFQLEFFFVSTWVKSTLAVNGSLGLAEEMTWPWNLCDSPEIIGHNVGLLWRITSDMICFLSECAFFFYGYIPWMLDLHAWREEDLCWHFLQKKFDSWNTIALEVGRFTPHHTQVFVWADLRILRSLDGWASSICAGATLRRRRRDFMIRRGQECETSEFLHGSCWLYSKNRLRII